jgi:hypothetical protein
VAKCSFLKNQHKKKTSDYGYELAVTITNQIVERGWKRWLPVKCGVLRLFRHVTFIETGASAGRDKEASRKPGSINSERINPTYFAYTLLQKSQRKDDGNEHHRSLSQTRLTPTVTCMCAPRPTQWNFTVFEHSIPTTRHNISARKLSTDAPYFK